MISVQRRVVIVDAVRTPIGKFNGALSKVRPDDLAAIVIRGLIKRNPHVPLDRLEDVYIGCANQAGEDSRNIARVALLLAGLSESVAGCSVNRLCGSGLEAVNQAALAISCGLGEVMIAGGVESMSRSPLVMLKPELPLMRGNQTLVDSMLGWRFPNKRLESEYGLASLIETAENVANKYSISREDQDIFALSSQHKYAKAYDTHKFSSEVIPVKISSPDEGVVYLDKDEHPRPDTTYSKLSKLKPIAYPNGTVTAGNSSGINDGAAAVLLMDYNLAQSLGIFPLAEIITHAVSGVHPNIMGIGPVEAVKKAVQRANIRIEDIDLIELNEAFASQVLACINQLQLDIRRVNVSGGAIALGHPLGSSGARILTTLAHELRRQEKEIGLATMCIGVGQGIATIIKRPR